MRFKTRNMILDGTPNSPVEGTIYPSNLSAEYWQSIFGNTIFNNLGYDGHPKEAFGVETITLRLGNAGTLVVTASNALTLDFDAVGDGGLGVAIVTIDLSDALLTRPQRTLTSFSGKMGGVSSFATENSYTVMLSVDQFVGIDFNRPTDLVRAPVHPLLNPNYPSVFGRPGVGEDPEIFYNRHTTTTRSSQINLNVLNQTSTTFDISISRTDAYTIIYEDHPITTGRVRQVVVPVYDYQAPGTGNAVVRYENPGNDLTQSAIDDLTFNSNPNLPDFDMDTDSIVGVPRNVIRVAWVARGT